MNSLTVAELKKLAKTKGIKGYSTLRKGELLSALKKGKKSRSRSGKRRSSKKSKSRSGRRRSVKKSKSRSGKRQSPKKLLSQLLADRQSEYTISMQLYFKQTCKDPKDVPSEAEIDKFIRQHALAAIKENITVYQLEKMGADDFSYNPSTRTVFFKVPGIYTRKQVEDYVKYLSQDSLEDTYYEGEPGKGLVVASKTNPKEECGVIDYRKAIKLEKQEYTYPLYRPVVSSWMDQAPWRH